MVLERKRVQHQAEPVVRAECGAPGGDGDPEVLGGGEVALGSTACSKGNGPIVMTILL